MDDVDERGEPVTDDTLLILLNASADATQFVLTDPHPGVCWEVLVDTALSPEPHPPAEGLVQGAKLRVEGRSLQLLWGRGR
jgi:glycogen operon protein